MLVCTLLPKQLIKVNFYHLFINKNIPIMKEINHYFCILDFPWYFFVLLNTSTFPRYYLCLEEGSTLQLECSDPLRPWFDYQTEVCQSDPNKCYPFCDVCQSYCVEKELIFDPSDCHDYYACDPPYSVHYSCPVNHYFDSDLHSCAPGSCLSFPRCD